VTKKIPLGDDSALFRHAIGKVRPVNNDKVLHKQEKPCDIKNFRTETPS
jgi:hypothetical protein